jgi:damage-control phosphatase, subfamily I
MRTVPECLACILGDVYAAAQQTTDAETALRVARASCGYLSSNFDYTVPPSYHITEVHRILKRLTGQAEPFAQRRRQANDAGLQIAGRVAEQASTMSDPADRFRYFALWALAANSLDSRTAGTGYAFDPATAFDYLLGYVQRAPVLDRIGALHNQVSSGQRVLYIHDNVGEIALDGLLIEAMRGMGSQVISAVRGGPITSDATWADAMYVRLDQQASSIVVAGPDTLGISLREASPELLRELEQADVIIAKGQANYYVFSEEAASLRKPVFCLFTVKCGVVGQTIGLQRRDTVAAFLPLGEAPEPVRTACVS